MFTLKSKKTEKSKSTPKVRFMPNFGHFKAAIKQLPDANDFDKDTISTFVSVQDKLKEIAFVKKRIQRGDKVVYRWSFEGKLLIREQDIERLREAP